MTFSRDSRLFTKPSIFKTEKSKSLCLPNLFCNDFDRLHDIGYGKYAQTHGASDELRREELEKESVERKQAEKEKERATSYHPHPALPPQGGGFGRR